MKELSPLGRELVKAGRNAHAPSAADKQRIHEALQHKLAAPPPQEPPLDSAALPKPTPTPAAPWPLISAVTVGAGLLAGALYWGLATNASAPAEPTRVPEPSVRAPQPPVVAPTARTGSPTRPSDEAKTVEPAPRTSDTDRGSASARRPSRDAPEPKRQLAEEVALLSKATSALHARRAQEALTLLAEHQRKFPRGALSVERRAARAQALCQLGRKVEAERELRRLSPSSPQAARARELCDSGRR